MYRVRMLCDKCNAEQTPREDSTEDFKFYTSNTKCICGGIFQLTPEVKLRGSKEWKIIK